MINYYREQRCIVCRVCELNADVRGPLETQQNRILNKINPPSRASTFEKKNMNKIAGYRFRLSSFVKRSAYLLHPASEQSLAYNSPIVKLQQTKLI